MLNQYRNLATVKGFVTEKAALNLLAPVDGDLNIRPLPNLLPSHRGLILASLNKFQELLAKEEPSLNVPYSLPFIEGLRYMLSNID